MDMHFWWCFCACIQLGVQSRLGVVSSSFLRIKQILPRRDALDLVSTRARHWCHHYPHYTDKYFNCAPVFMYLFYPILGCTDTKLVQEAWRGRGLMGGRCWVLFIYIYIFTSASMSNLFSRVSYILYIFYIQQQQRQQ
jgi:hypothetical protein